MRRGGGAKIKTQYRETQVGMGTKYVTVSSSRWNILDDLPTNQLAVVQFATGQLENRI